MARRKSPFTCRMMYGPSLELIDYARRFDANWVVVASTGHKTPKWPLDDPPVFMPEYEKLAPFREPFRGRIAKRRKDMRTLIRAAKKAGMKAIFHAYEPSLPDGFQQAYPRLHCKAGNQYAKKAPELAEDIREVCVSRPEVREALAAKVAETCRALPDLDGYMYSNNEDSTRTQVWHRCERCKDIPFGRMMKHLDDAMAEGIRRSGKRVRLFNRCWGTHETQQQYWLNLKMRAEFGVAELQDKSWLPEYVEAHRPANMRFNPKRDIPAYVRLLKGRETAFVYKATWADVNLHHPLNPWMGKYGGHDEICEFSFEHCVRGPRNFYIMGREMQRRARLCRRKGVEGICCVPVNWGAHDTGRVSAHPSKWSLNELNMFLFAALVADPDANLETVTGEYLRRRYGAKLPRELAKLLLDTENIAADAMNLRGPRVSGGGLANFYYELLRYAWMFPGWQKRTQPTAGNLKRIFAEKDRNVRRAGKMLQRIEQLKDRMPGEAYEEFHERFEDLLRLARRYQAGHKHSMMLWALKDGTIKPTLANLEKLYEYAQATARAPRGSFDE